MPQIILKACDARTGEPTTNPNALSATRCLALLIACETTADVILASVGDGGARGGAAMLELMTNILTANNAGLFNDIQALAAMLGCQLVLVDPARKADA